MSTSTAPSKGGKALSGQWRNLALTMGLTAAVISCCGVFLLGLWIRSAFVDSRLYDTPVSFDTFLDPASGAGFLSFIFLMLFVCYYAVPVLLPPTALFVGTYPVVARKAQSRLAKIKVSLLFTGVTAGYLTANYFLYTYPSYASPDLSFWLTTCGAMCVCVAVMFVAFIPALLPGRVRQEHQASERLSDATADSGSVDADPVALDLNAPAETLTADSVASSGGRAWGKAYWFTAAVSMVLSAVMVALPLAFGISEAISLTNSGHYLFLEVMCLVAASALIAGAVLFLVRRNPVVFLVAGITCAALTVWPDNPGTYEQAIPSMLVCCVFGALYWRHTSQLLGRQQQPEAATSVPH